MAENSVLRRIQDLMQEHQATAERVAAELLPEVSRAVEAIVKALAAGGCVYVFGNGGSAADAQHFTAELVGRFRRERQPLRAVALTTDSSALTCIGNDYSFAEVFSRPVEALVQPQDVVVGITTTGNSPNVVLGLKAARARGAATVALTGGTGGSVAGVADICVTVPVKATARVQEMHILIIHMICECIDDWALAGTGQ